jgi:hypothetical protein
MSDRQFHIGDFVQVVMRPDGAQFEGILQDFTDRVR